MDSVTAFALEEFMSHRALQIAVETRPHLSSSSRYLSHPAAVITAEAEIQEHLKSIKGKLGS